MPRSLIDDLPINPEIGTITTRYDVKLWKKELKGFYDVDYIINGLTYGFTIGIDPELQDIDNKLCKDTMYIHLTNKEKNAITKWFVKGTQKGYICGPFELNYEFPWPLHLSPLFVVPKPIKDEYRPIGHLSYKRYPWQYSVNDIISDNNKHVKYISFKEIIEMMHNAGKNAYMWTIDAQDAYYRIPIHRSAYKYMGLKWHNKLWLFLSLQMGLASAPLIYTKFGDAIIHIIVKNNKQQSEINGKKAIDHYLDDNFGVGKTKQQSDHMFNQTLFWLKKLNIPTQPRKCAGSNRKQKLLGWILNSIKQWCELPKNKKIKALNRLRALLKHKKCNKKQMEQLVGILQHIALIIFPGKVFVRRFEMLIYKQFANYKDEIVIDDWIIDDIKWWINILETQTHVRTKYTYLLKSPSAITIDIYTDAASTIGAGGFLNIIDKKHKDYGIKKLGYQIKWDNTLLKQLIEKRGSFDIHAQEMLGALIAVKLWAPRLTGACIALYNDNPGAAGAIITKAPPLHRLDMQYMIRELAYLATIYKFYFWGIKINGDENDKADALSRFKDLSQFELNSAHCTLEPMNITQKITNEYMQGLIEYRLNVNPNVKKWDNNAIYELNVRRNEKKGRLPIDYKFTRVQTMMDYIN